MEAHETRHCSFVKINLSTQRCTNYSSNFTSNSQPRVQPNSTEGGPKSPSTPDSVSPGRNNPRLTAPIRQQNPKNRQLNTAAEALYLTQRNFGRVSNNLALPKPSPAKADTWDNGSLKMANRRLNVSPQPSPRAASTPLR